MNTNQTREAGELLPCPFCGSDPEDYYGNGERSITCPNENCAARCVSVTMGPDQMERVGLPRGDYEKWAADHWNHRATESHLRAQLAEAEKKWHDAMELMYAAEKRAQKYMHERDAAQARAGEMEGLLREARAKVECGMFRDRIDAALATSPHRLAGRGE